ncbi:Glycine betaine/proline transport system permease protein OS=Castellaniella defragrans OX=75697 GN=HNR28_003104 PE=3 SV=1 [Castellaniella defragrans]
MFPELISARELQRPIDAFVNGLVNQYSDVLRHLTQPLLDLLIWADNLLQHTPWWLIIAVVVGIAWLGSRKWRFSLAMGDCWPCWARSACGSRPCRRCP